MSEPRAASYNTRTRARLGFGSFSLDPEMETAHSTLAHLQHHPTNPRAMSPFEQRRIVTTLPPCHSSPCCLVLNPPAGSCPALMGAAELGHRRAGGHHALCAAIPSLLLGGGVPSLRLCWSLLGGRGSYTAELCGGWPSWGYWVPCP